VELQRRYADGKRIGNGIQANGILLDDRWGEFLARHEFLVGLSADGPRALHDRYRVNLGGEPGLNYLCAGYRRFFRHIDPYMRFMAEELGEGRAPANEMAWAVARDRALCRAGGPFGIM
jgi:uncharacterized protein